MRQVIFLYNELLDKSYQEKLKLPLEFISFAYIDNAVMYDLKGKYVAIPKGALKKTYKYEKVYGALFLLHNSEHFLRLLDASLVCSKTLLGLNHKLDEHHRVNVKATPIHFKSVEEFFKMKYNEGVPINVICYIGNPENEFIKRNVLNTVKNREVSGLDINNFINLVMKEIESDEK